VYKIGGRDFILKALQQSPELQVTPEQKIFFVAEMAP
jgi:hypothetical protein